MKINLILSLYIGYIKYFSGVGDYGYITLGNTVYFVQDVLKWLMQSKGDPALGAVLASVLWEGQSEDCPATNAP
jgi:hypothetical protein